MVQHGQTGVLGAGRWELQAASGKLKNKMEKTWKLSTPHFQMFFWRFLCGFYKGVLIEKLLVYKWVAYFAFIRQVSWRATCRVSDRPIFSWIFRSKCRKYLGILGNPSQNRQSHSKTKSTRSKNIRNLHSKLIFYSLTPCSSEGDFERVSASWVDPFNFFLKKSNIDKNIRRGSFVGF